MIDFLKRARLPPYEHQIVGANALVKLEDRSTGRVYPGCFMIADEMGAMKTKQAIDAICSLYVDGKIDRALTITILPGREVWSDPDPTFGELAKHLWADVPTDIIEFHSRTTRWRHGPETLPGEKRLLWVVTNYEFIRSKERRKQLTAFVDHRTYLILDESSAVKNHSAKQTRACMDLRKRIGRVTLLNGSPIAQSPLDLYSQGRLMDPRILDNMTWTEYRARYCVMGGFLGKEVLGYQNLDELQRRFAPYVLRRLKSDCMDLPEKLPPTILNVALSEDSWSHYKKMRDELVTWLDTGTAAVARHAAIKSVRLSQITSGFLGGLEVEPEEDDQAAVLPADDGKPSFLKGRSEEVPRHLLQRFDPQGLPPCRPVKDQPRLPGMDAVATNEIREIGSEKLDLVVDWIKERLDNDEPELKLLLWCRFRPELERLYYAIKTIEFHRPIHVGRIWGGQDRKEREEHVRLLKPGMSPKGPVVLAGTLQTGSMSLDFSAAHHVLYVSNGWSLMYRKQSEDRPHRFGQTHRLWYGDVVATGPRGQKTIDHTILKALRNRDDIATWTTAAWVKALTEE